MGTKTTTREYNEKGLLVKEVIVETTPTYDYNWRYPNIYSGGLGIGTSINDIVSSTSSIN